MYVVYSLLLDKYLYIFPNTLCYSYELTHTNIYLERSIYIA